MLKKFDMIYEQIIKGADKKEKVKKVRVKVKKTAKMDENCKTGTKKLRTKLTQTKNVK